MYLSKLSKQSKAQDDRDAPAMTSGLWGIIRDSGRSCISLNKEYTFVQIAKCICPKCKNVFVHLVKCICPS